MITVRLRNSAEQVIHTEGALSDYQFREWMRTYSPKLGESIEFRADDPHDYERLVERLREL
jgi:hypothetical protein